MRNGVLGLKGWEMVRDTKAHKKMQDEEEESKRRKKRRGGEEEGGGRRVGREAEGGEVGNQKEEKKGKEKAEREEGEDCKEERSRATHFFSSVPVGRVNPDQGCRMQLVLESQTQCGSEAFSASSAPEYTLCYGG